LPYVSYTPSELLLHVLREGCRHHRNAHTPSVCEIPVEKSWLVI